MKLGPIQFPFACVLSGVILLNFSSHAASELFTAEQIYKDLVIEGVAPTSGYSQPVPPQPRAENASFPKSQLRPPIFQHRPGRIALPIEFEFDSARLTYSAQRQLDQLAIALGREGLSHAMIGVVGHTDAKGQAEYNLSLSFRRASTARAYLVQSQGLSAQRFSVEGKGESELLSGISPRSADNRRVEFVNLGGM